MTNSGDGVILIIEDETGKEIAAKGTKMAELIKKDNLKKSDILYSVAITFISAILSTVGLYMLIYPANFAPTGVDGIITMLHYVTGFNAGIFSLILKVPLLLWAWFVLNKKYVCYTLIYTILSSLMLMAIEMIDVATPAVSLQYQTETDLLIPAIFGGILLGLSTGLMIKIGASTGGIDIIACILQKWYPHANVENLMAYMGYVIVGASYFVYKDMNSILLSIVLVFVFEKSNTVILRDHRAAYEVKIITEHPEQLKTDILYTLRHGATVVESRGMFTEKENFMVITIINYRQLPELMKVIQKYPNTFVYYSEVVGVRGNFRRRKNEPVL